MYHELWYLQNHLKTGTWICLLRKSTQLEQLHISKPSAGIFHTTGSIQRTWKCLFRALIRKLTNFSISWNLNFTYQTLSYIKQRLHLISRIRTTARMYAKVCCLLYKVQTHPGYSPLPFPETLSLLHNDDVLSLFWQSTYPNLNQVMV